MNLFYTFFTFAGCKILQPELNYLNDLRKNGRVV